MKTGADSFDPSLHPIGRMSGAVAALRGWVSKLPRPYAILGSSAAVPDREAATGDQSPPLAGPTAAPRDPLQQWHEVGLRTLIAVGIFSVFVNLLMLTMPIYLFQISDRVLTSRSMDTLVMLSLLALGFILVLSLLDTLRRQVLGRLATKMETILGGPVIASVVTSAPASDGGNMLPLRSLHQVRGFMSSPTMVILFDAPMAPLYFAAVFLIHPSLGFVTLAAVGVLLLHRPNIARLRAGTENRAQLRRRPATS
jgi:ABC-type protease/lipase transport system fused ATPase/permease subunit